MNGFVQIITGKDFPSDVNNTYLYPNDITQPLLAVDHVEFAGQPLAIVVAETNSQAKAIAQAVKVTYKNEKTPLLTVKDAIQANSFFSIDNPVTETGNVEEALNKTKNMVSGELHLGYQYHFYMETQIARAEPTEEGGFKLDIATQMQKDVQDAIAFAFNTSSNKIELTTKRIGGAYGGKATNSIIVGCAAALASHCTRRPVCFHGDLKTCMTAFGTRTPFSIYYTVGYDDDGILEAIDCKLYTNSGPTDFDGEINDTSLLPCFGDSAYFCSNRRFKNFMCKTNIPSTTWCRSPGSLQLTGFADQIVEHVAKQLGKDPISVKRANLYKDGQVSFDGRTIKDCNLTRIHDKLMEGSNIQQRQMEIDEFNKNNIWKKRGLAVTPMRYRLDNSWGRFAVLISICAGDGTVIVSHGGIESGQGIHTKVAQVLSYELGVPVNDIMVQRTTSVTSPNSTATGGSITSEVTCKTVLECCKILKSRIEPVRAKMDETARWRDVIERCYREDVDLQASYLWIPPANETLYNSYGCTASEIELDVLTGEFVINQVDIIFDCGISLNPSVDIGQVEGAFVMGLGFWLTEEYILDKNTGRLLNDGTWDYNVPTSKDIPVRWNIELLKNSPNPVGILRSKASGEPPMCMSISVLNALKRAVEASRRDRGMDEFFQMPMPATVEKIHTVLKIQPLKDFKLL
uniref:Xanthine dehydrogenase/oxidase-like n=1 Tax=Phallusia mammillata TaxID=59560 RepID=A0A6F9DXU1_9ASCI|nr:xanthine dehydrogenase/oxidase-like [Phallusia mammillata]